MITANSDEQGQPSVAQTTAEVSQAGMGMISKAIYSTSYGLSFGVMLPILYVSRALPWDSTVGRGLVDGAAAACDTSEVAHQRMVAAAEQVKVKAGNAYAGVAERVQSRVESVQDAVAARRFRKSKLTTS